MKEKSELSGINEDRFENEAERLNHARPLIGRILDRDNVSPIDIAHQEALVQNQWRSLEDAEGHSPLNEITKATGTMLYRPFIMDTPEAVEAYAKSPQRSFGFATGYGMTKMFGAIPSERLLNRVSGSAHEERVGRESFNDLILRFVEKKIERRQGENVKPIQILELAAGRSYGDEDMNYGAPWLSRLLKIKFGDAVDVSICETLNDWLNSASQKPAEEEGPAMFYEENGVLDIVDDTVRNPKSRIAGPGNLAPAKQFVASWKDGDRKYFVRPKLDPVFEKMVFGVNAYGNVEMGDDKSIRAMLGISDKTFDLIFLKNSFNRVEPEQIEDLLSDGGIYVSGGLWKSHFYHPITGLAEKTGNDVHSFDNPEERNSYLHANGLLGEKESLDGSDLKRERAARESILETREGARQGVAAAEKI